MRPQLNFRGRLVLLALITLLPAAGLLAWRAVEDRARAAADARRDALGCARVAAAEQRRVVDGGRQLLQGVALAPVLRSGNDEVIDAFLRNLKQQNPRFANFSFVRPSDGRVTGSAVPLNGEVYVADRKYFGRAVKNRAFAISDYVIGRESGQPQVTLAMPILDPGKDELVGLLTAAVDLEWLQHFTADLRACEGGTVTVVARGGTVMARAGGGVGGENWLGRDVAETPLVHAAAARREGVERTTGLDGQDALCAFTAVREEGEVADVHIFVEIPTAVAFAAANRAVARDVTALVIVSFASLLLSRLIGGRLARRVERLAGAADRVAAGDLEARAGDGGRDEIGRLGATFDAMVPQLRSHLDLRQSLALAMEVQQSLLPAAAPSDERLEIAARSLYCDETGGDYYDFLDVSHPTPGVILLAVGDVTGHGVAAALLMASARAALRVQVGTDGGQLATLMDRVNGVLAADNRHNKFMTMALVVVDPARGVVHWSSAGHDPTIVFHPAADRFEELDGGDLPLGIDPTTRYEEHELGGLQQGDLLILGTDGIWETRNTSDELFGKERLRACIRESAALPVSEIATAIERRLAEFRGGARVLDDITYVLVRVK